MARGRRRRTMNSRKPRKFDWVYRTRAVDIEGPLGAEGINETDGLASYYGSSTPLTPGAVNARALILYDSQNRLTQGLAETWGNGPGRSFINKAGRAEGRKPLIRACEGTLFLRPSAWALGSSWSVGWRLGIFKQDAGTGLLVVPQTYSMFDEGFAPWEATATHANTRGWVKERREQRTFNPDNAPGWHTMRFFWSSRRGRTLEPDECWALYMESDSGSVSNLGIEPWCRTLVSDEG